MGDACGHHPRRLQSRDRGHDDLPPRARAQGGAVRVRRGGQPLAAAVRRLADAGVGHSRHRRRDGRRRPQVVGERQVHRRGRRRLPDGRLCLRRVGDGVCRRRVDGRAAAHDGGRPALLRRGRRPRRLRAHGVRAGRPRVPRRRFGHLLLEGDRRLVGDVREPRRRRADARRVRGRVRRARLAEAGRRPVDLRLYPAGLRGQPHQEAGHRRDVVGRQLPEGVPQLRQSRPDQIRWQPTDQRRAPAAVQAHDRPEVLHVAREAELLPQPHGGGRLDPRRPAQALPVEDGGQRDRREGHHVGERRLPLPHRQRRQDDGLARPVLQLAAAPGAPRPGVPHKVHRRGLHLRWGDLLHAAPGPRPSHDVLHVPRRRRPHPRRVQERRGDARPPGRSRQLAGRRRLDEPPEGLRRQPRRHSRLAETLGLLQPSWAGGSRRHYGGPPPVLQEAAADALRRGVRRCDERAARLRPREAVRLPRELPAGRGDVAQAAGDGRRLGRPVGAAHRGARRRGAGLGAPAARRAARALAARSRCRQPSSGSSTAASYNEPSTGRRA